MNTPDALNELLTELGHPPATTFPDLRQWGYSTQSDSAFGSHVEEWALFEPLHQRGWVVHFDAEGQFFVEGEHTKLMLALLTVAGINPLPNVQDTWIAHQGWVFEVHDKDNPMAARTETTFEHSSDYAELYAILDLLNHVLSPHNTTIVNMITGDQSACLCVLPSDVLTHLIEHEWMEYCEEYWDDSGKIIMLESHDEVGDEYSTLIHMDDARQLTAQNV